MILLVVWYFIRNSAHSLTGLIFVAFAHAVPEVDTLKAEKICRRKDPGDFDEGVVVMVWGLGISKSVSLVSSVLTKSKKKENWHSGVMLWAQFCSGNLEFRYWCACASFAFSTLLQTKYTLCWWQRPLWNRLLSCSKNSSATRNIKNKDLASIVLMSCWDHSSMWRPHITDYRAQKTFYWPHDTFGCLMEFMLP